MASMKQVIEGLQILAKYVENPDKSWVSAEHDQIWAGPDRGEVVSEEDKKALEDLGWFEDDDCGGWSHFC